MKVSRPLRGLPSKLCRGRAHPRDGGAKVPSKGLAQTATGKYLQLITDDIKYFKDERVVMTGGTSGIVWVEHSSFGDDGRALVLTSCEDFAGNRYVKPSGAAFKPGGGLDRKYRQQLDVTLDGDVWKVADVVSEEVDSCER